MNISSRLRYKCEECGKGFITPSKLQRHSYSHSGLRPFQCNICGKSFSQSANLKTHIKNTHPETLQLPLSEVGTEQHQLQSLVTGPIAAPAVDPAPASAATNAIAKAIAEPKSELMGDNSAALEESSKAVDDALQPDY